MINLMKMYIRESIKEDLEKVVNLRVKLWEFEKATADFNIKIPNIESIREEIIPFYENEKSKIFVVEEN
jgi:hypothetical protein